MSIAIASKLATAAIVARTRVSDREVDPKVPSANEPCPYRADEHCARVGVVSENPHSHTRAGMRGPSEPDRPTDLVPAG